jgi:hypothetical protein
MNYAALVVKGCLQNRKDDSAESGAGVRGKKGPAKFKKKV